MEVTTVRKVECQHRWVDGWASEDEPHICHLRPEHDGKCRCICDAETYR